MGRQIAAFPARPDFIQTVTLGSATYRLRLFYRVRLRAWYLDLLTAGDVELITGRRLSPGWSPLAEVKVDGLPDGYLYVEGADLYRRGDLGSALRLLYYSRDEIPAAETSPDGFSVSLS